MLMRYEGCELHGPYLGVGSMDPGNGMMGAAGLMMALYHRDRTGEGQFVECPQLGSAVLSTSEVAIRADGRIEDPLFGDPLQLGYNWHARLYEGADGWLVVDASSPCSRAALLGLTGATAAEPATRIASWAASRTVSDAIDALTGAGVPAIRLAAPYEGERFFRDPEHRRLERIAEYRGQPHYGEYHELGQFWRLPNGRLRTGNDAWFAQPVGAQTVDILQGLGFSRNDIDELVARKVVAAASRHAD
jgi:crotonobetainyl-CoA:carnitine CoA-transferase CaiB-like acyl-CoA transferase